MTWGQFWNLLDPCGYDLIWQQHLMLAYMASQPAGGILLQDNTMADRFIRIPDDGIPDLDNQLEQDIHINLEGVEDEDLFA